ncbi:TolC family protein [Mucilaginibacter limnophilus]|uniref:TolC family protein n=1 Tax=Mucilaginibacter limnophilus TaxID=1932778 RepID=A0A3S2VKX9_9SPHI|nr:TolC family protein [Mucilaginibacter limnophilus]RVT98415.1 TolC family protein [Mucilaginibacter limnophilus]
MLRLKLGGFIILQMLMSGTIYAQAPKSLSLKMLLRKVSQTAPTLQTDSSAILIKEAQARETGFNWLPNLKLNYQANLGTNNNVGGPYFSYGIVPSNARGVRDESNATTVLSNLGIAAFDWEVYNFGGYQAQNKAAAAEVDIQKSQYAQSKFSLETFTIDNYLQLMRLQELETIQLLNIDRNQEIRQSIRALARSGIRPGVDTSIAEAELSKSRLNYIELTSQSRQIQLKLSAISGLPYETIIPDTTTERKLFAQSAELRMINTDTLNHPLVNYYRSLYNSSITRENLVKKSYNPKILFQAAVWGRGASLDADQNFKPLHSGWGFQRENYLVGLGVTFNLFDLKRRQVKLSTQKLASQYALNKLYEQRTLLSASAAQADAGVSAALDRLNEIPKQLKAANAAYRQKFSLYKNGLTDIIELNAALNLLYRAETDLVSARYSYVQALFQKAVIENQVSTIINLLN